MLIAVQQKKMSQLTEGTPFKDIGAPEHSVLDKLEEQAKANTFWGNYQNPIFFCYVADKDKKTATVRDHHVTGEILKTLSILNLLASKVKTAKMTDFDYFEYTHAVKVLEEKIDQIDQLKAPTSDPENMRIRLKGTDKVLKINIAKVHEAVTFSNADGSEDEVIKKEDVKLDEEEEAFLAPKLEAFTLEITK